MTQSPTGESALDDAVSDAGSLTLDDAAFLRAVAMVGDVVRDAELGYLIARGPWTGLFDRTRVTALIDAGLLHQAAEGCFVTADVASAVANRLPLGLHPILVRIVGEALALEADSLERLQMGIRRLRAQSNDAAILAASKRWASTAAGIAGPRGARFVDAIDGGRLSPALQAALRAAVADLGQRRAARWSLPPFPAAPWLQRGVRAAIVLRLGFLLPAVWAVLMLGSCQSTPARAGSSSPIEPREPRWFIAPPLSEGHFVAVAAREASTIQKSVAAADAETRARLASMLQAYLRAAAEGVGAEVSPTRRDEVLRALRPLAREVAQERADSALRREYLIEPRTRGYRAYVLSEVSKSVATRTLAARIARDPALLTQVGETAAYRALAGVAMLGPD
jgi:hypothetical protein